ncbi:MAG: SDR family oxidoreductase, partial [Armatimonadetes bacterium]|nr:SDR family oxidoreductase [Armatimonadota bacterium]
MDEQARKSLMKGVAAGAGIAAALYLATRNRTDYSYRGKVALITGGSRGLGLVMARMLAREGARLVLCARDEEELAQAREELAASGTEVLAHPCDVGSREQVEALVGAARERFGPVDVLINNAGMIQVGPMELMTEADYEQAMRVHFWGPLYTTLAVLPDMRERRAGRIVNVSSIGGKVAVPHLLPYVAS